MKLATKVLAGRRYSVRGSSICSSRPPAHDRDPVADGHGLGLVVGHVDGGDAEPVLELGQLGAEPDPLAGVHVGERLVQQEHLRDPDGGPADGHPLALPGRQRLGLAVEELAQPQHPGLGLDPLLDLVAGQLAHGQPEAEVLGGGEVGVEGGGLEHHGHVALARGQVVDHPAADADGAAAEGVKAGDQSQDGALAAAAGADDHHQLGVADMQAQVRDGLGAVWEHPGDIIEQDIGHAVQPPPDPVPGPW